VGGALAVACSVSQRSTLHNMAICLLTAIPNECSGGRSGRRAARTQVQHCTARQSACCPTLCCFDAVPGALGGVDRGRKFKYVDEEMDQDEEVPAEDVISAYKVRGFDAYTAFGLAQKASRCALL